MTGWRKDLLAGANQLGLQLSAEQTEALVTYLTLLIKWNSRLNLVGPGGPHQLIERHLLDSLAVAGHLPATHARLIDVGAGAGLPSIPLAIIRSDVEVTALEPIHKKSAFLAAARRELSLDNFQSLTTRVERHQASPEFSPYDIAVSRAAFALEAWFTIAKELVRPGGLILGMEGASQVELPPGAVRSTYSLGDATRGALRTRAIIAWVPEPTTG